MPKETETEERVGFFVTFLLLVAFPFGDSPDPYFPPGYAYAVKQPKLTCLFLA